MTRSFHLSTVGYVPVTLLLVARKEILYLNSGNKTLLARFYDRPLQDLVLFSSEAQVKACRLFLNKSMLTADDESICSSSVKDKLT